MLLNLHNALSMRYLSLKCNYGTIYLTPYNIVNNGKHIQCVQMYVDVGYIWKCIYQLLIHSTGMSALYLRWYVAALLLMMLNLASLTAAQFSDKLERIQHITEHLFATMAMIFRKTNKLINNISSSLFNSKLWDAPSYS